MVKMIEVVAVFITNIVSQLGYLGIGLGMFLESACIPLPSELILPLGGFMIAEGRITLLGANVAVLLGSLLGSVLTYWVGFYGGRSFILKYGKYFFISKDNFDKAEKTFNKHGVSAVFFGRLLPVIRTFISLPAGITKMNFIKFVIYSLLGMVPWNFLLIFLGYKFGENYELVVRPLFKKFEHISIMIMVIVLIAFVASYMKKKKSVAE
ncbi:MAG: DedA family protein [Clostridiales bacterium]|nr:DedA family protein [Clostridiales bacterium]